MTTSQIFASQMIEIDLGFDINPSPLYQCLIEDVNVAIKTIFKNATFEYYKTEFNIRDENNCIIDKIDCTDFTIIFNDNENNTLLLQEFENNCVIIFNPCEENEKIFKIQKNDFNFDCILKHIENELNIKFNQNDIKNAITYFSDLWD